MDFKTEDGTTVDFSKLFDMLGEWFDAEMYDVYRSSYRGFGGIMLGAPVWGEKHIGIFGRFCLSSMMSEANREALSGSTVVLFTRRQDLPAVASIKHRLMTANIGLLVYLIPDAILDEAWRHPGGHYWILGVVHQLIAKMAGWAGMGFHMLLPDHIFCDQYFPNLNKLMHLHEAIAQTSMSVSLLAINDIEAGRQGDGTLSLHGRRLGDIGLQHLHQQMRPMILNGKNIETSMPSTTTWLAWRGKNALSIYSPHMNVAYLSPRVCLAAPARIPHTMDTELPNYMREGFYVPQAEDGLCFIEISDNKKEGYPAPLSWDEFASTYWQRIRWQDKHLPFARTRGEVPLSLDPNGMETTEIEARHDAIMDRLVADKGRVTNAVLEEANQ